MKNLLPIEVTNKLKELSGIDVFESSRESSIIEIRSLVCHILRNKRLMRWTGIADFFKDNGKSMNHATVINSVKQYDVYKLGNKKLTEWEQMFTYKSDLTIDQVNKIQYLENKVVKLEKQLKDVGSNDSIYNAVKNIPNNLEPYVIKKLDIWQKEYAWKNKLTDSSTVYSGQ